MLFNSLRNIRPLLFTGRNALNASSVRQARTSATKIKQKSRKLWTVSELESFLLNPVVKPKASPSAFALFVADFWKRPENKHFKVGEGAKLFSEEWKSMTESQKKRYKDMASRVREAKQESLHEYASVTQGVVKVTDVVQAMYNLTKAAKEERIQLKQPKTGATLYMRAENNEKLTAPQLMKRWRALDDRKKGEYNAQAEKAKQEVTDKLREWRSKWKFIAIEK